MSFKLLMLPPFVNGLPPFRPGPSEELIETLKAEIPGIEIAVGLDPKAALDDLRDADAVYGLVPAELFGEAKRLRWIAGPLAGLGEAWFYPAVVESDVIVTNVRGIYNEQLSVHILGFILAFAHRFDTYFAQQAERKWAHAGRNMDIRQQTVFILGLGGSGAETARLCKAFGMSVLGTDARPLESVEGVDEIIPLDQMPTRLGDADFVVITVPETRETRGMFNAELFARMKHGSYLINIARGALVKLDALVDAMRSGRVAGAGLDVAEIEPLPADHPLWTMPGVLITPHSAINGAEEDQVRQRVKTLVENCRRFASGQPLLNVMDKQTWF